MIGIICAMQAEADELIAMLDGKAEKEISGIKFIEGKIYQKSVVIAVCGIGKVFAAIAAEAMIITFKPELIINSGVAGALCKDLRVADIALAEDVVQHDMDTTAFGDPPGLLSGINIVNIPCDKNAVLKIEKAIKKLGISYIKGRIASGDVFVNTRERKIALGENFSAAACEMEGASIGHVCYVNKVPFAVLRSVSDSLSDNSEMEYSEFLKIAVGNMVRVMDEFLKEY